MMSRYNMSTWDARWRAKASRIGRVFARVDPWISGVTSPAWQGWHVEKVIWVNTGGPWASGFTPAGNPSYKAWPKWAGMCPGESEQTIVAFDGRDNITLPERRVCTLAMFFVQGRAGMSPHGGNPCP